MPGGQVWNGFSTPFTHWTKPAQPSAATVPENPSAQQAPPALFLIVGAGDTVSTGRRLGRALGLEEGRRLGRVLGLDEGCGLTVASVGAPSETEISAQFQNRSGTFKISSRVSGRGS